MTNTQNVTELQPRMTREQLIDAARIAAKYLPVASAQLMNELANRLDYTSVALCEAMAQRKDWLSRMPPSPGCSELGQGVRPHCGASHKDPNQYASSGSSA